LYLGGAGLARGYVGRPDLTADRFVPDPFSTVPGARLYRTGDLVRWRADGQLEFVGRNDFQVKVRGHRIELGEVENALRAVPSVRDAVVVARALDLVAYVTGDAVSSDNVKAAIRTSLPDYMVPAHVIVIDTLPLTPSGKINRGALPDVIHAVAPAAVFEEASTDLEQAIARVWQDVLGVPRVGVRDSFFDLGGNSILLARVLSQLRRDVAPHLTLLDLFTFPRIQDLAAHLSASSPAKEQQAATRISDRAEKQRAALAKNRRPPR
jgi:non-ribosomal peptide synthetase component F